MIPSYRTINRITQLIVYAGNNSVVVILVGTDGHGHDNIHIIISMPIPNSLLSFHRTYYLLSPRQMARIKSKQGIKLNEKIEGTNQNEDEK